MAKKTDPGTIDTIVRLHQDGCSYAKISEQTGVSKSTVRDIIKAWSKGADKGAEKPDGKKAHVHARNNGDAEKTPESADKGADYSAPQSAPPTPSESFTKEETIASIRMSLQMAKRGYENVQEGRGIAEDLKPRDLVWAETQYIKLIDKINGRLMTCSGLDAGVAEEPDASALSEFSKSLEGFKDDPETP